jgi:hypothetical protein
MGFPANDDKNLKYAQTLLTKEQFTLSQTRFRERRGTVIAPEGNVPYQSNRERLRGLLSQHLVCGSALSVSFLGSKLGSDFQNIYKGRCRKIGVGQISLEALATRHTPSVLCCFLMSCSFGMLTFQENQNCALGTNLPSSRTPQTQA